MIDTLEGADLRQSIKKVLKTLKRTGSQDTVKLSGCKRLCELIKGDCLEISDAVSCKNAFRKCGESCKKSGMPGYPVIPDTKSPASESWWKALLAK